ncbi:MAG: transcriptional repressor [Candidatus Aegiribacteria sp.]|nr:transcriptional repressor [Candidatus Aegiribacteria sp.]
MNRKNMIKQQVCRNTKQRQMILRTVKQLGCHPTAEQIFDTVRKVLPRTSLSTVYRNLGILVDQGEIIAVSGTGRKIHYDHNIEEHNHIKCVICGKVSDVSIDVIDINSLEPDSVSGYIVKEVHLNFVGICPECAEQLKRRNCNEY